MALSSVLLSLCWTMLFVCRPSIVELLPSNWLQRQRHHEPVKLDVYSQLRQVALMAERQDPEGQLFDQLLEPLMQPRYVNTRQHRLVQQHLVDTMTSLGWHVDGNDTFYSSTPRGRLPFTNVVATHDVHAPRRLVLACHYDSIFDRPTFTAATDSAVPCAMMLYLAALVSRPYLDGVRGRAELTLQLMFFDGEEAIERWTAQDSIYGSRYLAEQLHAAVYNVVPDGGGDPQQRRHAPLFVNELQRIDLLVLLDLLGARQPRIANYIAETGAQFKQLARVEWRLSRAGLLPANVSRIFRYQRSWGLFGPPHIADDHLPFQERGVNVLHLIPHPFPDVWHQDADNASVVHYPTVDALNRILRVFVLEYLNPLGYPAIQ